MVGKRMSWVVGATLLLLGSGCGFVVTQPYVQPAPAPKPAPAPEPPVVVQPAPQPPVVAPQVIVPRIVGSPLEVAEIVLAGNQLRLGTVSHKRSSQAPGTVLSQSPLAGQTVSTGSRVSVVLALEKTRAQVPAVVGKGVAQAATALRLAGLETGQVSYVNMPGVMAPLVGAQNPSAGLMVEPGTAVNLVIHTPAMKVRVPNLYGLTQIDAMNKLADAGLELSGVGSRADPMAQPGTTVSQDPAAGGLALPGSGVAIVISTGAGRVTVPNLVGSMTPVAVATLVRAGLRSQVSYEFGRGMPHRVMRQSPLAGTAVDRGTLVTLFVSRRGGLALATVPQVVGVTQDLAAQTLANSGLVVGTVTEVPGPFPGQVTSQSPAAGTRVRMQTAVDLVVTRRDVAQVRVPNVVGMKRWAAQMALLDAGLEVGKVTTAQGLHHNVVKAQQPGADVMVPRGSNVDLIVYRWIFGSRMVTVPNIVGMNVNQAEEALEKLSLIPGRVGEVPGPRPNVVMSQTPTAGANVRTGTMIAITVSMRGRHPGPHPGPRPGRQVTVPNVVGKQRGQAEAEIRAAGLTVGQVTEVHGMRQNEVVSQSPAAFSRVDAGTPVQLNVVRKRAVGPSAIVPSVINLSQGLAESRIRAAGLVVGTVTEADGPRQGRVMAQDPVAATRVARGSAVNLTVARRRAAGGLVTIPSVVGKTRAEAETTLRDAGLRVGTVTEVARGRAGTVVSQSPSAGMRVRRNSAVNLNVARGATQQQTVLVPNVVGSIRSQAERALRNAGLNVGTVTEVNGTRQNIVMSQSPGAGTRVNAGSSVDLTVARRQAATNTVTVPSVTGQTRGSAEAEIRRAGLVVGNISYVDGDRDDVVVSQSPGAGGRVARGSAVALTLSRKRTEDTVVVPNVVGMPLPRARAAIRRAGLQIGNVPKAKGGGRATVKSQNPAAGSRVARGTKVDLEL